PGSGLSEGRVFDERGRSIALCSQRLRFIPGTPAALGRPGRDAPAVPLREVGTVEQLHGGIMLCATEVAGHDAVRPEEGGLRTSAVHITYVRPGPLEGEVTFAARTVHRGRSLAVAQVVSRNPAGKICSYATVTSHAP
ncbi:MAG TPA: hotdog fold thioesterase, partial [Segeticoccus sp.]|nr:hotdog fold thioesterase [Segeticoccus sp.]